MVTPLAWPLALGWLSTNAWLLAVAEENPPARLDPPSRATLVMALLGLIVLGLGLVLLVVVGGRYVRRLARKRHEPTDTSAETWFRKPLNPTRPNADSDSV